MIFNKNVRQLPARRQIGLKLGRDSRHFKFIFLIVLVFFGLSPLTFPQANAAIDTYDDLAIGIPQEAIGSVTNAGAVGVLFGTSNGLSASGKFDDQFWSKDVPGIEGTATAGEKFGQALAAGDFNGDGWDDLAIGVPYESVGGAANAGAVYILYGGPTGPRSSGSQVWNANTPGLGSTAENGDIFGFALAAGDFNHDGFADLAIGAAGKTIGAATQAGQVQVLYGSTTGLSTTGAQIWDQGLPTIQGAAEGGDFFGYSLATGDFNGDGYADLAVGVPYEDIGAVNSAGAVAILYGSASGLNAAGNQLWYEDLLTLASEAADFFGWALAAGDFNGDGRADLAIGSDGKDLGGNDRGAVTVIYGTAAGLNDAGRGYFRQNVGLLGEEKDGDYFGKALAAGDFNADGFVDLAIGVPGDDYSGVAGSGAVNVIKGSAGGLTTVGDQIWVQNDLSGLSSEVNDGFGRSLATGDFNGDGYVDLAVGVPFEDEGSIVDAGAIHIIFGSPVGLIPAGTQYFSQNTPATVKGAAETNDRFGYALAAGKFGKPEGLIFMPLILRQ